ncbi:MAG: efflux transporter outer membrane subunit, partial [Verrucomicrobiae bacterium]|nr:efflux transporter outer membrane subunit [Verrucomicrobiae bacterium]
TYKANAALLHEQIATSRNNLVFLVGANIPDDLLRIRNLDSQEMLEDIPPGLPSDLLVRRPDIRAAEHQLQAANASIGVARAAFFPSVKLTAFGGSASTELDGLFGSGTGTWSFAPSVTVPIFNSGRNQANLEVTEIERDIRIANYEKTIQGAFREVADALAVQANIQDRLAAQEARIRAARRRFELSEQRFNSGVDSYLPVLLAQQELYAAELSRVLVRLARLSNLTSLYSALGGGWLPVYESP